MHSSSGADSRTVEFADDSSYCTGQHYVVDGGLTSATPMDKLQWVL